jgi:Protein of unknown function (DUF3500)
MIRLRPVAPAVAQRWRRVAGLVAAVLVVASCSSGTSASAPATPPSAGSATATSDTAVPAVAAAATAFLATLDDSQRDTVLFDWTDTEQKQRWSNFPRVAFQRAGLQWKDLNPPQQDAWLAIMRTANRTCSAGSTTTSPSSATRRRPIPGCGSSAGTTWPSTPRWPAAASR